MIMMTNANHYDDHDGQSHYCVFIMYLYQICKALFSHLRVCSKAPYTINELCKN